MPRLSMIVAALALLFVVPQFQAAQTPSRESTIQDQVAAQPIAQVLAASADPSTQVDYFLDAGDIKGESTAEGHANQIDVRSYEFGVAHPVSLSPTGSATGKTVFDEFKITKVTDKASPRLFLFCAQGKHIPKVVFTARKRGDRPQEFLTITLRDVLVSSYQHVTENNTYPVEQVSFTFSRIDIEYRPQNADGTLGDLVKAGWDLKSNKGS
jgi:type VI secretion system secreted protein Hcp